jgi:hypothetical protein
VLGSAIEVASRSERDDQVTELDDIELKLRTCATESAAKYWARQLVQAQWEAGKIPMAHLSHDHFEAIVKLTVKQLWEQK